jgi:hypothetical protein
LGDGEKKMTLREKQSKFVIMVAKLILFAYDKGYELTFGEGYDDDGVGHMKGSVHYVRLGQDLNAFLNDVWLDKGPEMEKAFGLMHDFWDTLGGAKRIDKDLNHFSFEWEGRR